MNRRHEVARSGNVVQTARTNLNGERRSEMTLALGFGADRREAIDTRAGVARARLRRRRARVRPRLARVRRRPQAASRERARLRPGLLGVGDGARRERGQAQPRSPHRLAEHALGLGPPDDREAVGRVPPRMAARPLPGGDGSARARRQRRGEPAARLHLRATAEARRLVPAEHARGRRGELDQPADGRGGAADRAGLAAAPLRGGPLREPREEGGRLHRRRTARSARRSAGRTRAAGRPGRSPRRSPGSSAPRTSRAATATWPPRRAGS